MTDHRGGHHPSHGRAREEALASRSRKRTSSCTAYHEGGHAVVSYYIPECDNVHEVTIIPRGQAGGYTMYLPGEETSYRHGSTTSPRADRQRYWAAASPNSWCWAISPPALPAISSSATEIARSMVTEYGMSEEVGPIYLGSEQEVFLGQDLQSTEFQLLRRG